MTTADDASTIDDQAGSLAERLFGDAAGAFNLYIVDLGLRLGLYEALERGPATSKDLAARTNTDERYVREWLAQQASNGVLTAIDPAADDEARMYELPKGHAEALLNNTSLAYIAPMARMATGFAPAVSWLEEAFRTGAGVPWEQYGAEATRGQMDFTRPMFVRLLATEWLPAIEDVEARLRAQPPARVADIACGAGVAALELAKAYPGVQVDGFDIDRMGIDIAREAADAAGLADRVRFHTDDIADPAVAAAGPYDLVTIFEAVHDMANPVGVLRAARQMLAPGGTMIVADENTGNSFATPGPMDAAYYSFSVLLCLPASREQQPSAATGTVMRADTFHDYASQAGFTRVEILPIENDFWRFYRLTP